MKICMLLMLFAVFVGVSFPGIRVGAKPSNPMRPIS